MLPAVSAVGGRRVVAIVLQVIGDIFLSLRDRLRPSERDLFFGVERLHRSVADDAKPWPTFPLLVLHASVEQMGGYDLIAFCGKDATGAEELDETALSEEDPRRTHVFSFQHEVVTDRLIGGSYALKRARSMQPG